MASPEKIEHVQATLQLLSVMTQDHRFEEVYNASEGKGAINNMCEVLDRVESRGVARGRAQGMAQGRAQGMAQGMIRGEEKKAREMALKLYQLGMKPSDIAEVASVSPDVVQKWLQSGEA